MESLVRMWGSVLLQEGKKDVQGVGTPGEHGEAGGDAFMPPGVGTRRFFLWAGVLAVVLPSPLHGSVFAPYSSFAAFGVEHPAFGLKAATRPLWALTGAFVVGAWPGRDAGLGVGLVLAYGAVFRRQRHQG